jgi:gamma-glutamyltranspeptidase/glutathione hydrolase
MVASLRAIGGVHTLEDFAATRSDYTTPVSGHYKGVELVEHPPNGQGATAILLNHILAEFDIASMDPWGTLRAHIEAEATKLAYATRDRIIADPDHVTGLQEMLDPATGKALAAQIDPAAPCPARRIRRKTGTRKPSTSPLSTGPHGGVDHLLDLQGFRLGRGLRQVRHPVPQPRRGFRLDEGHPNEAMGGKRPMHTIIPAMLKRDGKVIMPFGVMGGQYQSTGHSADDHEHGRFRPDPQAAIDAPRCFTEYGPMKVEKGYSPKVHQELADLGHDVVVPPVGIGGAQAIRIHEHGVLEGGSDPRKDGCALGY